VFVVMFVTSEAVFCTAAASVPVASVKSVALGAVSVVASELMRT
jgi:hypothetical protein